MRWLGAVTAIGTLVAQSASAQSPEPYDPLALPAVDAVVMCRSLPRMPEDSASVLFEWRFAGGKEIDVAYDSSGVPKRLTVLAPAQPASSTGATRGTIVRFGPGGATGAQGAMGGDVEMMTEAQTNRARNLAVWLWNRRCPSASSGRRP